MDGDEGGRRGAARRQFLEDDGRVEPRHLRPANIALDVDAGKAERRRLPQHVHREVFVCVPFGRVWREAVGGEAPGGLLNGALVLGELKIHAALPMVGQTET